MKKRIAYYFRNLQPNAPAHAQSGYRSGSFETELVEDAAIRQHIIDNILPDGYKNSPNLDLNFTDK